MFFCIFNCTALLAPPGEYHGTVDVRRRCDLLSNYFDHLLVLSPSVKFCSQSI